MLRATAICALAALVLVPLALACQDDGAAAAPPAKVKVLILDGQNNHDWKKTTMETKATLLACGRFEVDVASTPADRGAAEEWAAWKPAFSDYDVVFSNYNDGGRCLWSEETKQALVDFVKGGGGLVIVHAAWRIPQETKECSAGTTRPPQTSSNRER